MSNTLDLDLLGLLKLARGDSREGTVAGPNPTALPSLVSEEDVGEQRSLFDERAQRGIPVSVEDTLPLYGRGNQSPASHALPPPSSRSSSSSSAALQ